MNIVEPILFQARYQPEAPALCAQGIDVVSYARLRAQMNNVARCAFSYGLKRGNIVALSVDQPLLHCAIILGLTQVGIVPVSVAGQAPPVGLNVDAVICDANYSFAAGARRLPSDYSWIMGNGATAEIAPTGGAANQEVCRIILTSGSTGDPKAVALTHSLVAARNARLEFLLGSRIPILSRFFMNMGLASARGYYFLIHVLGRGGTIFFHGGSVENTLRSIEVFQIQAMLATPTSLVQMLDVCDQFPTMDIHFDTIVSGGSLLPRPLLERVRPRLCANLISVYGATETNLVATAPAHRVSHIPGAVGYLTPGSRIEIVDEADRPLPTGVDGVVRIASEVAVDHYIDDPIESAQAFRNGWFYPGDVGSLTEDNLLVISGRRNNVLNAGGGKMAAERIEAVITSYKGVGQAAVFMATDQRGIDQVWAAIVCVGKVDTEMLREHCRRQMPAVFVPARVVLLDALPVGAGGKIDRSRLKEVAMAAAKS